MISDELVEKLADLEHEQWMAWTKTTLNNIRKNEHGDNSLSEYFFERWSKNWVIYQALPDNIKEFDRMWARKVLQIIEEENKK